MEQVFETLEIEKNYMKTASYVVEPIVNRNFGHIFHHQNVPN